MKEGKRIPDGQILEHRYAELAADYFALSFKHDELKAKYDVVYAALEHDAKVKKQMLEVLRELQECSEYWSEYYVPVGIHERIANAIKAGESEV